MFNYFYVNAAGNGVQGLLVQFRGMSNVVQSMGFQGYTSHNVPNMRAF